MQLRCWGYQAWAKGDIKVQGLVTGGEVAGGVCVLCQDDGASGHQCINDGHCCWDKEG